jgi:hypothetical protein
VLHVPAERGAPMQVSSVRDADRLAELNVLDVIVTPDVPPQGR